MGPNHLARPSLADLLSLHILAWPSLADLLGLHILAWPSLADLLGLHVLLSLSLACSYLRNTLGVGLLHLAWVVGGLVGDDSLACSDSSDLLALEKRLVLPDYRNILLGNGGDNLLAWSGIGGLVGDDRLLSLADSGYLGLSLSNYTLIL